MSRLRRVVSTAALTIFFGLSVQATPPQSFATRHAGAQPAAPGMIAPGQSDDHPGQLAARQRKLTGRALEARLRGKTKGRTHLVARGQYVELAREGEDTIWTVFSEFGDTIDPAIGGTPGPWRNQIPSQLGVLELASPAIAIPNGLANGPHMSFDHWVALEDGFDGAQLMISVNGGPFHLVDPSAFIFNPYNKSLLTSPFTDNVRMGQPAFSGVDAGSVRGSWGTSIVDLSAYAHAGDTIRLRFDMSTDSCFGTGWGWYVDNVRVYTCDRTGH
jgi:hypothetical protein